VRCSKTRINHHLLFGVQRPGGRFRQPFRSQAHPRVILRCGLAIHIADPHLSILSQKQAKVAEQTSAPLGTKRMSKTTEFQIYTGECLAWAKSATTVEQRNRFLDLARTWMRAAVTANRNEGADDLKGEK
jgi:hypothetical protein